MKDVISLLYLEAKKNYQSRSVLNIDQCFLCSTSILLQDLLNRLRIHGFMPLCTGDGPGSHYF